MKQGELGTLMDELEPLSAGVVFGRDEAWQKLQARIQQKKRRRIVWVTLSSAAAMLLAVITIVNLKQQEPTLPVTSKHAQHPLLSDTSTVKASITIENPTVPFSICETKMVVTQNKEQYQSQNAKEVRGCVVPEEMEPTQSFEEKPIAATPIQQVYPVVYIGEIDSPFATGSSNLALSQPNASTQLQTIHINDIQKEAFNLKLVAPEQRSLFEVLTFSNMKEENTRPFLHIKMGKQ